MNLRSPPERERTLATPLSARGFIATFAGVALSFIGATAYSQYAQRSVNRAAVEITSNAAPSIEHLGKARTDLRHIEALLYEAALGVTSEADALDAIARARTDYERELEAYIALPTFPGEEALWEEVHRELTPTVALMDMILAQLKRGDVAGVRVVLAQETAAIERAIAAISRSLDFDVAHTRRLAKSIEATRNRALLIEWVLDGVSAALALVAGVLLFRAVRHYTALIEAHHRLTQRRADELEQFAARVAHDILSPLGAAGMALAIADKSLPEGSKARDSVARGNSSLARVQRIVAGLLEFARAGAQPAPDARAEVGPIVDDVVNDVRAAAAEARIEVTVEAFEPCAVASSPGILTSLLANLVRNAVKYMGDRSAGNPPVRRVNIRVRARGERIRFEVADTGPGIPEHLLEGIFEPYVRGPTSGQPGIGLGLATVNRITQTHGGAVGVQSSLGRGSVFWFELPRR